MFHEGLFGRLERKPRRFSLCWPGPGAKRLARLIKARLVGQPTPQKSLIPRTHTHAPTRLKKTRFLVPPPNANFSNLQVGNYSSEHESNGFLCFLCGNEIFFKLDARSTHARRHAQQATRKQKRRTQPLVVASMDGTFTAMPTPGRAQRQEINHCNGPWNPLQSEKFSH